MPMHFTDRLRNEPRLDGDASAACDIIGHVKIRPWLQFFRLPNLPTAPGDALAGAAVLMCFSGGNLAQAVASGAAALFLYMFGLADNDIVGASADGPERPLARGDVSMRAARTVRALCLAGAGIVGTCARLPPAWWGAALALAGAVLAYNRTKGKWLMGLCRGLSVVCGAFAVWRPACDWRAIGALACLAGGWTLYIAAVTKLSEGEERDSEGLGCRRFVWGVSAFVPLGVCAFMPDLRALLLPAVGSFFAFLAWCAAVVPLGAAHASNDRRRAVGQAIGALLYLQVGYMLVTPCREFLVLAILLWVAARLARRLAPEISGS